jgi:hypothetical protein
MNQGDYCPVRHYGFIGIIVALGLLVVRWGGCDAPGNGEPGGLHVQNGWFVHDNNVVWGWAWHNGWWRAGQRPNVTRRSVGDPLGDIRPNRTENLDALTDAMLKYALPGFEHNFGLWYDRRRDAHDTARRSDANVRPPFLEQPWARSKQGRAWDGLPKYDLTSYNPWYFQRLEKFADLCDAKGTVLLHKYYMQHALLETQAHYADFPWRPSNCIQKTDMPDRIPAANAFYDITHPVRRALHRAYIRRCLQSLGRHTNVVHMIGEEYTGPADFVAFWIDTIVEWQEQTGRRVHIALGAPKDVQDAILSDPVRCDAIDAIDLRYWWIGADGEVYAPAGGAQMPGRWFDGGYRQSEESSPEQVYAKVRQYRDRYPRMAIIDALAPDRRFSWAFLMAGGSMLIAKVGYPEDADPLRYIMPAKMDMLLPTYQFIRKHLARTLPYMKPLDLLIDPPAGTWCLGAKDNGYLVYALHGGKFRLDLSDDGQQFRARWFDPRSGELQDAADGLMKGGKILQFQAPDSEDWVLWLDPQGRAVTPDS